MLRCPITIRPFLEAKQFSFITKIHGIRGVTRKRGEKSPEKSG